MKSFGRLVALGGTALALAACEIETGTTPENSAPGVYKGAKDEKLAPEKVQSLRERGKTAYQ